MTQQERTENKLIAEFLGLELQEGGTYFDPDVNECIKLEDLDFTASWDMLMQVVDKIESIVFDDNNSFNVTIGSTNYCVIQDANGEVYDNVTDHGESKILTTLYACVEFVKWYNNQNKQT